MSATTTLDVPAPARFAGLPASAWFFALRTWAAMVLALYAAFWLQLESASSAAVCVGILALPTRGQAVQKALFRFGATVLGVAVSFVIAGLFSGSRELFLLATAAWLALCVFAAGLLDGNRAYGAVLSGYTVSIVAVAEIDAPQTVFATGVNRGAAIAIGIVALFLVNDLFAAPDSYRGVLTKLRALDGRVRALVDRFVSGTEPPRPEDTAALLGDLAALHPDITALRGESVSGRARAAGARDAILAMVREIEAARTVAAVRAEAGAAPRPGSRAALVASEAAAELAAERGTVTAGLEALGSGRGPASGPSLPLYRPWQAAARNALRAFVAVGAGALALAVSGWPQSVFALSLLGATMGISATNPNPRAFARAALIAMPLAVLAAGVTEFLVLDGVDAFPLLAIAMAPVIIGGCLMMSSGHPALFPIGFLLVVFFPVLLAPSNPQSYDPQTFLITGVLAITAVAMLFVTLSVLMPTSDAMRRRWILTSARRDSRRLASQASRLATPRRRDAFRDADRLGQLGKLGADQAPEARAAVLRAAMGWADLSAGIRRLREALAGLPGSPDRDAACQALDARDPVALRRAGDAFRAPGRGEPAERRRAAAALFTAAVLVRAAQTPVTRPGQASP